MPNWFQRNILGQTDFKAKAPKVNAAAFENPNAAASQSMLQQRLGAVDARQAPTMQAATIGPMQQIGGADFGRLDAGLGGVAGTQAAQGALAQRLTEQAMGIAGPSLAEQTLQRGLQQNIAGQMAVAGSTAGAGNPALAGRQLQNSIAAANLDTAGQAAMLRSQEQMQAQNTLATVLAQQGQLGLGSGQLGLGAAEVGQRGDMFNAQQVNDAAVQQAAFQQGANQSNLGAALQTQAMQDQMAQYYVSQGLSIDEANRRAQMDLQHLKSQNRLATNQINANVATHNAGSTSRFIGGLVQGTAAAGAMALAPGAAPAASALTGALTGSGVPGYQLQMPTFGGQPVGTTVAPPTPLQWQGLQP